MALFAVMVIASVMTGFAALLSALISTGTERIWRTLILVALFALWVVTARYSLNRWGPRRS